MLKTLDNCNFISLMPFIVQNDKKLIIKRQPRPLSSLQKMKDTFETITNGAKSPTKEPIPSIEKANLRYNMSHSYKSK